MKGFLRPGGLCMQSRLAKLSSAVLSLSLACAVPSLLAEKREKAKTGADEQKRAVHALNRLAFGPRPGDVQQVMAMGIDRWIDQQLHPERISDAAMDSRLAPFRTLQMNTRQILEEFPDAQMIRAVRDGKKPMPSDPVRRAVYQVQIARYEQRREKKAKKAAAAAVPAPTPVSASESSEPSAADSAKTAEELAAAAAASPDATPATTDNNAMSAMAVSDSDGSAKPSNVEMPAPVENASPSEDASAGRREDRLDTDLDMQPLLDLPPDQRYKKILSMTGDELLAVAGSLRGNKNRDLLTGMDPRQRETLLALNNPQGVVAEELEQAKVLRAVYSDRQLQEVMTDFWFNHFNIFAGKGPERLLLTSYEQEVIRPHALGKFEDLLVATAKSPAMLFYLDNWLSVGPNSMQATGTPGGPVRYGPYGRARRSPQSRGAARRKNSGLNENYGRELLELHTLSVNGGYSQRDVTEVAKVFTGWTIEKPFDGMGFRYDERMHEPGPKFVLGHRIKPKGEDEGREVLHLLANSPQTARFISWKLAQRFVSDDPPPALVDRMAKTFEHKKGDIREVLSTLFHSPEFWADASYRAKVKTPLEFVASAVRATGAEVEDALPLARQLNRMGMPLYGAQPPTGYSMKADKWVSSSALLDRMNFALALTAGKVRGVRIDTAQLAGSSPPLLDAGFALTTMEAKLLASDVSRQTHDSIVAQMNAPAKNGQATDDKAISNKPPDANMIAGLLLGSPEFQRR